MSKLVVIDGHNLLFQMFFGMSGKIGKNGQKNDTLPLYGAMGFIGALRRIMRMTHATHILVVFDGDHENPRAALFPAYKMNRPDYSLLPDSENPYLQIPYVYAALSELHIPYIETTDVEADDLIAGCVKRYVSQAEIIICSFDSDFCQLVGRRVKLLHYSAKNPEFCGIEYVQKKFGISPKRYADYKSLIGDKSDNIPGIAGCGAVNAVRLINRFGDVEHILSRTEELGKSRLKRCLTAGSERIRLNYRLIKLGLDPNSRPPFDFDELLYTPCDMKNNMWQTFRRTVVLPPKKAVEPPTEEIAVSPMTVASPMTEEPKPSFSQKTQEKPSDIVKTQPNIAEMPSDTVAPPKKTADGHKPHKKRPYYRPRKKRPPKQNPSE